MAGIYRFINTTVPTVGCNLRCEYCYVKQWGEEDGLNINLDKESYRYSIQHMIEALKVERMGGVCMFNFSAHGETLLSPCLYEIVTGLINNGHYVAIISNCTVTNEIKKYIELDSKMRDHLFFKASFHYRELKKRGLLEAYANNIKLLKDNGISFSVELVSNDYILDELEEVKEFSLKKFGALPHVLGGREETTKGKYPKYETKLSEKEFRNIWGEFDSPLFRFQDKEYLTSHYDDFCYAGVYTGTLDLSTGDFMACPGNRIVTNFFDDLDNQIQFLPVGENCPFPFCFCGFFLQVLAGSCSDSYPLEYKFYEFRDRECVDGTHWLTPTIKEVFNHTCAEYHEKVNEEEKYLINTFLRVAYKGYSGKTDSRLIEIIKKYFEGRNIKSDIHSAPIGIYGMSGLGQLIADAISKAGLTVTCGIDKKYKEIEYEIPVFSPEEVPDEVEIIMVTAYGQYARISNDLKKRYPEKKICSILDLIGNKF